MRVLFAVHGAKDPQTAVYANNLARATALSARGHVVTVLTPEDLGVSTGWRGRVLPVTFALQVAAWLRRQERFDLVICHSHAGWVVAMLRAWLAPSGVTRLVTTFHGLEPLYYRELLEETALAGGSLSLRYRVFQGWCVPRLIRLACRRSDLVLCLNSTEAAYLRSARWARPERIAMQRNFVLDAASARSPRPEMRILLFVGQWDIRKGTRYLADAFTRLARSHQDLELWCAGTLSGEAAVHASFPPDVRSRVRVWPRVDREGLQRVLSGADVFVLPSLFEGASLALLEALAAGLPVITTPAGEAPDLFRDGISALLVPLRDAGAIVGAVERLRMDPDLRERLATAARQIAASREREVVLAEFADSLEQVS